MFGTGPVGNHCPTPHPHCPTLSLTRGVLTVRWTHREGACCPSVCRLCSAHWSGRENCREEWEYANTHTYVHTHISIHMYICMYIYTHLPTHCVSTSDTQAWKRQEHDGTQAHTHYIPYLHAASQMDMLDWEAVTVCVEPTVGVAGATAVKGSITKWWCYAAKFKTEWTC